jgi:hypothetical protein
MLRSMARHFALHDALLIRDLGEAPERACSSNTRRRLVWVPDQQCTTRKEGRVLHCIRDDSDR